jgi:S-adenosylmethionine hydrolase
MEANRLIAILTDFGLVDHYVAVMKGVVRTISPSVQTIDITHEIPPGDIQRAAIMLWQASSYFPPGTVFLCVVDPGVGTARRPIILESGDYLYVGPDNGLFSFVLKPNYAVHDLSNPAYHLPESSMTFHGRDIFAPVAAYAANGVSLSMFGDPIIDMILLPQPLLEYHQPNLIRGQILHKDRFGNLITSIGCMQTQANGQINFNPWLSHDQISSTILAPSKNNLSVELPNGTFLMIVDNFQQIPDGMCAVIIGSSGLLEIVANKQDAASMLDLADGEIIKLLIS